MWYVGALGEGPGVAQCLAARLLEAAGVMSWDPPEGVEWIVRPSAQGPVTFVLNHTPRKAWAELMPGMTNLLTGQGCSRALELDPLGVAVLVVA